MSAASTGFIGISNTVISVSYIVLPSRVRSYVNPTLVRTRGVIGARGNLVAGVQVDMIAAAGVIAWSDRDDATPTDPPRPFTDPDLDWIWHGYFYLLGGATNAGFSWVERIVDSQAMRKLGADMGVLLVLEGGITNTALMGFGMRCLIKE